MLTRRQKIAQTLGILLVTTVVVSRTKSFNYSKADKRIGTFEQGVHSAKTRQVMLLLWTARTPNARVHRKWDGKYSRTKRL